MADDDGGGRFGGLGDELGSTGSDDTESEPDNGPNDEPQQEVGPENGSESEPEPDDEPESESDGQSDDEPESEADTTDSTDSESDDGSSENMGGNQSTSDGGNVVTEYVDISKPGVDYDPSMQRAIYVTEDAWRDHKASIQFEIERMLYQHGVEDPLGCEIGTAVIETAMERPTEIAERVLERRGLSVDLSDE